MIASQNMCDLEESHGLFERDGMNAHADFQHNLEERILNEQFVS